MVECEDKVVGKMYAKVAYQFMTAMMEVKSSNDLCFHFIFDYY